MTIKENAKLKAINKNILRKAYGTVFERLAEYEALEEAGRLVRLPEVTDDESIITVTSSDTDILIGDMCLAVAVSTSSDKYSGKIAINDNINELDYVALIRVTARQALEHITSPPAIVMAYDELCRLANIAKGKAATIERRGG